MSFASKIALLREMLENAESNIRSAKRVISEIAGTSDGSLGEKYVEAARGLKKEVDDDKDVKIVEGVFDGQGMIGPDEKMYPVPANYASKSKLVAGDVLKLSITENGSFIYKQIGPVERKRVTGPLTRENSKFKVLADGTVYNVLLASVTYYKAEVGDEVTLLVPAYEESEWGTIDNVLPRHESPDDDDHDSDEEY